MRVLEYSVNNDNIQKTRGSDHSGLIPKSGETVMLKFTFSNKWNDSVKVVEFTTRDGKECTPQILVNNMCEIPEQALKEYIFYIRVLGKTSAELLTTKKATICQDGGKR